MTELTDFGTAVLVVSAVLFLALAGMRVADRLAVPYAAIFLLGAVALGELLPAAERLLSIREVERIAVVALIVILFHGGLHIGLGSFRRSAGPILALGVFSTFATAGLVALVARYALGFGWVEAGLVGAAIAPTDPAVTFSVFGARELRGRAGLILEGESAVNDPVGIALMVGMIEFATESGSGGFSIVVGEFVRQMAVGLAVGGASAYALLPVARRVRLTSASLYPIRVLAAAGIVYGLATVAGGSGFLAVFVAGVLLGDAALPRKGEIESFHASLAGLAEIAVFVALGLSIGLGDLWELRVWEDGLALALALTLLARPLAVLPLLLPVRLRWNERLFIVWGGLKGAVPILLGALAVIAGVEGAERLYGIVFVVVLVSVLVQGASLPWGARRLRLPFVRVDHDLAEVLEFVVREEAPSCGRRVAELPLAERAWLSAVIRDGRPLVLHDDLVLAAGDRVHVYSQPDAAPALRRIFEGRPT
ncbi:MAG TPA: cation:proton antiporter [Gaiellaceae bacterium]|nr:cation:proton antiporter [Gaiellaceae bacterium]